jgi:hypothetical protein
MKTVRIYGYITPYPVVLFIDITTHVETNYRTEEMSIHCNRQTRNEQGISMSSPQILQIFVLPEYDKDVVMIS